MIDAPNDDGVAPSSPDVEKAAGKGVPFQPGFDPRRNVTKPGTGRPSDEFRASLREMIGDPKVRKAAEEILSDPKNRQFAALWKAVAAQAHGAPRQEIELDGALPVFKVETE